MIKDLGVYTILIPAMLLVSCVSLRIEKRVHRKGFHIELNRQIKSKKEIARQTENQSQQDSIKQPDDKSQEEIIAFSDDVLTSVAEENHSVKNIVIIDNNQKQHDKRPLIQIEPALKRVENNAIFLNEKKSIKKNRHGTLLIITGILLIVLGALISAVIFAVGGELLGFFGLIGIVPGVIVLIIGQRRKKLGFSGSSPPEEGVKINKWALASWILLPFCFLGTLAFIAVPSLLTCLIIATIQFRKNPGKYKKRWMVDVLWILVIVAASLYILTALFVLLFWGI